MPRFADFEWELIAPQPMAPHLQMALDEVLLGRVASGERPPTVRFWEWGQPALVLGSHQVLANEIDVREACLRGFSIARRMSGGGTMIVEPRRSITYSIYAPESVVKGMSYVASFAFLDGWVVDCLRALGVPAGYRPINDIVSPEGKIGGAAQARRRHTVLHHTAIAFTMDPAIVPRLIRIGRERVSPRGVRSAEKAVSPLSRWTSLDRDGVVERLWDWFAALGRAQEGHVSSKELSAAHRLAAEKYATAEWLNRMA